MNLEVIRMNEDKQRKISLCMYFVQDIRNPDQLNNASITSLVNALQSVKLNAQYLKFLPRVLFDCCDTYLDVDKNSRESVNISASNLNRIFNILFETPLYKKPSHTLLPNTTLLSFFPVLGSISRKIMNKALEKPSKYVLAILDCHCFLYAFLWEYIREHINDSLMPRLDDVYYLENNIDIPYKHKQLLFLREVMDKFGLVNFHHTFIYQAWQHTGINSYTNAN